MAFQTDYILERENGQKMTFPEEMIDQADEKFNVGPTKLRTPSAGPMANIGNDFEGVAKRIVISGLFTRQKSSIVTGGNNPPTIKDPMHMKYWIESIANGNQFPVKWQSYLSEYTLESAGGTTTIEGEDIPGGFVKTEGYIDGLGFKEKDNPDRVQFSFTIWVAGS